MPNPSRYALIGTTVIGAYHLAAIQQMEQEGSVRLAAVADPVLAHLSDLRAKLERYIKSCPSCQQSKPSRRKPYGELLPVRTPSQPFEVLALDFVVGLPEGAGFDAMLVTTCKLSKWIRILPGREDYSSEDWAIKFWDEVVRHQALPAALLSDRDPKFTSKFWECLLRKHKIKKLMTAGYHPNADGQAERSNQSVEIALRCLLAGQYEENWTKLLPEVELALNTSRNASTGRSPYEVIYGFKPRLDITPKSDDEEVQDFAEKRQLIRKDVETALELAQTKMAIQYDQHHTTPLFRGKVWLRLIRSGKGYKMPGSSKLSPIRTGPFTIKRQVGQLAWELELPEHMKIHPVISCIHLEQYEEDPFHRLPPEPKPVVVDGQDEYVVEKLLQDLDGKIEVKWKGLAETTWEPRENLAKDIPEKLKAFDKSRKGGKPKFTIAELLQKSGSKIQVRWEGYDETTWEPRARLLQDVPEMVRAFEAGLGKGGA